MTLIVAAIICYIVGMWAFFCENDPSDIGYRLEPDVSPVRPLYCFLVGTIFVLVKVYLSYGL